MAISFPPNPSVGYQYVYNDIIWQWNGYGWFVVGAESGSGLTGEQFFFNSDLVTAFGPTKSFGKYGTGETIPSLGKTAVEVIREAMIANLAPTVSLTSSTTIQFNQTAISNVLNFSHTINTLGATVASAVLDWKRSNEVSYTTLSGSTVSSGTYTHTLTDTNYNTNGFNYRYTVTDSVGATAQATKTITPAAYVAPVVSITQRAGFSASPETDIKREKGNVQTNISAGITRSSVNVQITGWEFEFSRNGGAYTTTGFTAAISGTSAYIATGITLHSPGNTASSVAYRLRVRDQYQDYLGSSVTSSPATTINFVPYIFYGATADVIYTSNEVRALQGRVFQDSSTFILETGNTCTKFVAAFPPGYTLANAYDQTVEFSVKNAYLAGYSAGFNPIADYAGNTSTYNVYIMSIEIPYTSSHSHLITRS